MRDFSDCRARGGLLAAGAEAETSHTRDGSGGVVTLESRMTGLQGI